jgi:hypothetical protein
MPVADSIPKNLKNQTTGHGKILQTGYGHHATIHLRLSARAFEMQGTLIQGKVCGLQ